MKRLIVLILLPMLVYSEISPQQQKEYAGAVSKLRVLSLKLQVAEAEIELQTIIANMAKSCPNEKLMADVNGAPVCVDAKVENKKEK